MLRCGCQHFYCVCNVGLATFGENYSLTKIDELDDIFAHIRFNNIHIASNGGAFTYFVPVCIAIRLNVLRQKCSQTRWPYLAWTNLNRVECAFNIYCDIDCELNIWNSESPIIFPFFYVNKTTIVWFCAKLFKYGASGIWKVNRLCWYSNFICLSELRFCVELKIYSELHMLYRRSAYKLYNLNSTLRFAHRLQHLHIWNSFIWNILSINAQRLTVAIKSCLLYSHIRVHKT